MKPVSLSPKIKAERLFCYTAIVTWTEKRSETLQCTNLQRLDHRPLDITGHSDRLLGRSLSFISFPSKPGFRHFWPAPDPRPEYVAHPSKKPTTYVRHDHHGEVCFQRRNPRVLSIEFSYLMLHRVWVAFYLDL